MAEIPNAFEDETAEPCGVCLELARKAVIQPRAVMPIKKFTLLRKDNRPCCVDCQATETTMQILIGQHPSFPAARLVIANERCEGFAMPPGMMSKFGLCSMGCIRPCSVQDLENHRIWLERNGIPDSTRLAPGDSWESLLG